MFQNNIIKEIEKETDIVKLISETVTLEKKNNIYWGLCPFHKEKTPSFTVDASRKTFHCYGCGVGGNAYSFLMKKEKCTFAESVEKLAKKVNLPIPMNLQDQATIQKKSRLLQINDIACSYYFKNRKNNDQARDYLRKRGLTEDMIQTFRIGMSGSFGKSLYELLRTKGFTNSELQESGLIGYNEQSHLYYDKFWDRIIFPIIDENGNVVGFGGRVLGEGKPKYLNSPETVVFDKSHELYGFKIAKEQGKPLILCEGYLDVISMHQAGFKTAVASLGTSLTFEQAKKIASCSNTVFIAYDSDEPGQKAMGRAIEILSGLGLKVLVISVAPYKDVDELLKTSNQECFKERIQNSIPGKSFLVQIARGEENFYETIVEQII